MSMQTLEPATSTSRSIRQSLSQRLWGLSWATHLPWRFGAIEATAGSFAEALPFVEEHYASIFQAAGQAERFLSDGLTPSKQRFGDEMDVFLLRSGARDVGVLMGHPTDWSSYYVRTIALLPEARDAGIATRIAQHMCGPLRDAGVERMEADVSPGNLPMMRVLLGQGWLVTATSNSERWGSLVRVTKFLREDAESTFARQFCGLHVEPRGPRDASGLRAPEPGKEAPVKKFATASL